jgi:hypothetical protein
MPGAWIVADGFFARMGEAPFPDLTNLSATAILGWYAWHTARRTIPGLVRLFREELAAARAECHAEREVFRAEMALERNQHERDRAEIVAALQELAGRLPEPRVFNSRRSP